MNQNITLTKLQNDPFARVSKKLLNDENLSWQAKGIMSYLLGKPPSWKLRVSDLVNHAKNGKASIRAALNELRDAGYAKYEQSKENGRFQEGVWKISDSVIFPPRSGFQDTENRHLSKNDCSKNKSKESKETPSRNGVSVHGEKFQTRTKHTEAPTQRATFPAEWKPDGRDRFDRLEFLPMPEDFPSQSEFDEFVESKTEAVVNYRPDLYSDLCNTKWRQWKEASNCWKPINDWRKYVIALDEKILEQMTAGRN